MAEPFRFIMPPLHCGPGAIDRAGSVLAGLGARKVFVVSDPGLVEAGWTPRAIAALQGSKLKYAEYLDVSPNPRDFQVMAGSEAYRAAGCDAILAVGGGSVIDCAKGIGVIATNGGVISAYEGVDKIVLPLPILVCVPTTSGSSADVSRFAIINNSRTYSKMALVSDRLVPSVSLIDPRTLLTMPGHLAIETGLDALVHAVEAYVSTAASPLTDLHALNAIALIRDWLPRSLREPGDQTHREKMACASLEAGLAFSNASLGAVHAMAHAIGGLYDFPHGECNAKLLCEVAEWNFPFARERYLECFRLIGMKESEADPLAWFRSWLLSVMEIAGMGFTFHVSPPDVQTLDGLCDRALRDPCMLTNPGKPTRDDLARIYVKLFD